MICWDLTAFGWLVPCTKITSGKGTLGNASSAGSADNADNGGSADLSYEACFDVRMMANGWRSRKTPTTTRRVKKT